MGLDMMLYRKNEGSLEEVGYWRKANQIHNWFVQNVQEGTDDCGEYDVTREQLSELLGICRQILDEVRVSEGEIRNGKRYQNGVWEDIIETGFVVENPEVCEALLPSTSGFFFGSTDYDEYYMEDIRNTVEILEKVLGEEGDFVYRSSW